ncbi:MAG: ABC transporter permease [Dehalococcoidia bacterium]|nr:ABC transporter permease [Dehalococcoidia bacterium]
MTVAPPLLRARAVRATRAWAPVLLFGASLTLMLLAPALAPADPNEIALGRRLLPPGPEALLGTDQLGRDVLSRLLHGGQAALLTALLAVSGSMALAAAVGILAGARGGAVDRFVCALLDMLLALPGLLVALAILGTLGTGRLAVVIALIGAGWAEEARIVRSVTASVRASQFIEAATAIGATPWRIARHHLLPATVPTVVVLASLNLGQALLTVSALSFLGLGTQPPSADWGTMLAESRAYLGAAPWLMLAPGVCIVGFAVLANLVGDAIQDRLDPRWRTH